MTSVSTRPRKVSQNSSAAAAKRSSAQERFERRLSARRRRGWKALGALALLVAALVGAWWVLWRSDWLLVEQVSVTGAEQRWHGAVLSAADVEKSQPMVEVDVDGAADAVREVSIVQDVSVVRSWPHTIEIRVTEREPVLAVRQASGQVELVDREGVSIETVSRVPEGIPVVQTSGASGATSQAYVMAAAVMESLPDAIAEQVTVATVSGPDLVTFTLGERTLVWGNAEESQLKGEVATALLATEATLVDVSAPRSPMAQQPPVEEESTP